MALTLAPHLCTTSLTRASSAFCQKRVCAVTMPNGAPPEVMELVAAGKGKMAILQLVKSTGITMPSAQVVVRFLEFRLARA
jgi:hypothetical protein